MSEPDVIFRFLNRYRRRWIVMRAVEGAGMGLMIGAGICLIVMAVLWWRGMDGSVSVPILLTGMAVPGIVVALWNRPSLLDAACRVDQQLELKELLSTLVAGEQHQDASFRRLAITQARTSLDGLSPAALSVHRRSGRWWGGVALCSGVVLVLSLMPWIPHEGSNESVEGIMFSNIGAIEPPPSPSRTALATVNRRLGEHFFGHAPAGFYDDTTTPRPDRGDEEASAGNQAGPSHDVGDGTGGLATTDELLRDDRFHANVGRVSHSANGFRKSPDVSVSFSAQELENIWVEGLTDGNDLSLSQDIQPQPEQNSTVDAPFDGVPGRLQVPPAYRDVVQAYFDRHDRGRR